MCRLICAVVVCKWQKHVFSWHGSHGPNRMWRSLGMPQSKITAIQSHDHWRFPTISLLSTIFYTGKEHVQNNCRLMTKPTKWLCAQRRLRSAWASAQSGQSLLCAYWVDKEPSFLHADSEDSDQTGWMPRLIWVFAGRTVTLLVLSWGGSHYYTRQ